MDWTDWFVIIVLIVAFVIAPSGRCFYVKDEIQRRKIFQGSRGVAHELSAFFGKFSDMAGRDVLRYDNCCQYLVCYCGVQDSEKCPGEPPNHRYLR